MIKRDSNPEKRYGDRLIEEYGYDKESIRFKVPLSKGPARYTTDIMVYHQGRPFIVVEIKSPLKDITRDAEEQLKQYMIASGAEYGVVTDSINSFCYKAQEFSGGFSLTRISDIPSSSSIENNTNPSNKLLPIKHLQEIIWNEFDSLRATSNISKDSTLLDFIKIITAKLYDEKENKSKPSFYSGINDDAETVKSRIESILLNIKEKIGISKEIQLEAKYVKDIVVRLQKYSFLKSELTTDGLNIMYPQLIMSRELGMKVTPYNLVKFAVELVGIQKNHLVIDPACGLGGFLVEVSKHGAQILGFDINSATIDLARISMYLIGQNPLRIIRQDSLQPIEKYNIEPKKTFIGQFDLVITNPPFGSKITDERLDYYQFKMPSGGMTESMFLEQSTRLVKNNGRIIIILPEGFLFNAQNEAIRKSIIQDFKIEAVISLPPKLFAPVFSIKTSLLVLRKTIPEPNQKIFFAKVIASDSKNNSSDDYEEQFANIVEAFREYQQKNTISRKHSENVILTRILESNRLDFDYYSRQDLDKFKHPARLLSEIAELQLGAKTEQLPQKTEGSQVLPVRGQNIRDFTVDSSSIVPIKIDRQLNYKYLTLANDILMTRTGNPGNVGIVEQKDPFFIKENLIRIRPKIDEVDPYYLLAFFSSREGKEILQRVTTGTAIKTINLQNLLSLQIPIPPLDIQKRIAKGIMDLLRMKRDIMQMQAESETRRKIVDEGVSTLFQGEKYHD